MRSAHAIGGMLVGYWFICPRKAWLSMSGLGIEHEAESVLIGRQLHEPRNDRYKETFTIRIETQDGVELVGQFDGANLNNGILFEIKRSRAMEEAHIWQLRFYLWLLKQAGVTRGNGELFTGRIVYPTSKRSVNVELRPKDEEVFAALVKKLHKLFETGTPPPRIQNRRLCAKCAYEELCYG